MVVLGIITVIAALCDLMFFLFFFDAEDGEV